MRSILLSFVHVSVISFVVFVSSSRADSLGLSQLEFDGRNSPQVGMEQSQLIKSVINGDVLDTGSVVSGQAVDRLLVDSPTQNQGRARLAISGDNVQLSSIFHDIPIKSIITKNVSLTSSDIMNAPLLIPNISGPHTDRENKNRIRTETSWIKSQKETCSNPVDSVAFEKKVEALKELLFKFTGDDYYYVALNQTLCDEGSALTGLSVVGVTDIDKQTKSGSFKFKQQGDTCQYELTKNAGSKSWQAMAVLTASCSYAKP